MATENFYTAAQAREYSLGRAVVLNEIKAIEGEVEVQVAAGSLSATVGPGTTPTPISTTMTASSAYYNAWSDPSTYTDDTSKAHRARMDKVIAHFQRLGYTVTRTQQGSGTTWNWVVKW